MFINQAVFSSTAIPALAKSLDAATLRGKAIAANLANITTPGYQRIDVQFESTLQQKLAEIQSDGQKPVDPAAIRAVFQNTEPVAYRPDDPTRPGEINNVDIDAEAAQLAKTQIQFDFGAKLMQTERGMIESAVQEPKG